MQAWPAETVFPIGTTTVTYSTQDALGNSTSCSFDVTVEDTEQSANQTADNLDIVVETNLPDCMASVTLLVPPASDNCGLVTYEFHYRRVDANDDPLGPWSPWEDVVNNNVILDAGRYRVRWRAIDAEGSIAACTTFVTVEDVKAPLAECNDYLITFNGEDLITLVGDELVNAQDDCGILGIDLSQSEFACTEIGTSTTVTVTVTDVNGNQSTCTSEVTIEGLPCGWMADENGIDCFEGNEVAYDPVTGEWTITQTNCHNPITENTDEYAYVDYDLCGDGEIIAEVTSITGTAQGWAGVMMRETLDPQAKMVSLMTNLIASHRVEIRSTTGGQLTASLSPAFGRRWLRLQRVGNSFRGYVRSGSTGPWFLKFNINIPMNQCIHVGLAVNGTLDIGTNVATFDNVEITGGLPPAFQAIDTPGVPSYEVQRDFTVFPNPSAGQVTLGLGEFLDQNATIDVLDVAGQQVMRLEPGIIEQTNERLDMGDLAPGVYFIRLRLNEDGEQYVKRVTIVRP